MKCMNKIHQDKVTRVFGKVCYWCEEVTRRLGKVCCECEEVTGSMGISLFNSSPNKSSCVRSRLCNAKKKIFNCQMTVKTLLIVRNSYSYFCLSKFYYL